MNVLKTTRLLWDVGVLAPLLLSFFLTRIKFSFKVHVAVFNEGEEGFQEKQDLLEELKIKEDEKKREDKKIKKAKKINEAKQMAEKKAEAEKYLIIFSQVSFDF